MAPRRSPGDAGPLRRQGRIEALALHVKAFEHGHAFGHTGDEIDS